MIYSKNKFLVFKCMLASLLYLAAIPTYAQDTVIPDSNIQNQKEIEADIQTPDAENIVQKTPVTYKESTVKQYNKLCQTAESLIDKNNYEKAIESLNKAIKLCPETETAYALKSICLRHTSKNEEAKENAQKAYKINPNSYITNDAMGSISLSEGNNNKAIFFYDKAEQLNKKYDKTYINRGVAYLRINEYEKSIADSSSAIRINPNSIEAHGNRAYAYLASDGKKNAQLALKDANFLIQHEAKNMKWYSLRAKCYAYMNNVPMALADINKVVKNEPQDVQSYLDRLEVYDLINASQDLITKDIKAAEQYAGNDTQKMLLIANNAMSKKNDKIAERLIDKVLLLDPNNVSALYQKARIQLINRDYTNSLNLLNKIDESNIDQNYISWFYLTKALAKFGVAGLDNKELIREGISDLNKVIGKSDAEHLAYNYRGIAYIALGEYQLGINDINKAKESGDIYKDTLYWLGLANFKLGKKDADNIYLDLIETCSQKSYNSEEVLFEQYLQDAFDNTSNEDIAAKINVLSHYNINDYVITSESLMRLISSLEYPYVKIERAYEQNGKIVTLPYKNINCDSGEGISSEMKDKIILNLVQKAFIAAVTNYTSDVNEPLDKLFKIANTKQKIDTLLTVIDSEYNTLAIDCIGSKNVQALNKIIENISIYDSSNKSEQDRIKKILRKTYIQLANAEENENGLESAMSYYDNAIQYGYPKFDVYSDYAYYYFNDDDYFNTLKWATKALNTKADANMYALRGEAKAKLKDYDGAIYDYTKALGYNSKLYDVYFLRAGIYFDQKKWSMAQADYIKYATYNKSEPAAPFNIATCLQNQGKKQAALPWYEKAKSLYQESGNESDYNECVRRINRIKGYNTWW